MAWGADQTVYDRIAEDKEIRAAMARQKEATMAQEELLYGCDCGETYSRALAAWHCRKCYRYLGQGTEAVAVVAGPYPAPFDAPVLRTLSSLAECVAEDMMGGNAQEGA